MKYKIAFFTENNFEGKIPRNHPNIRTDLAWIIALNANHYNIYNIPNSLKYDIGIIIYPKNKKQNIDFFKINSSCNKIGIMQEGPNWYWETLSIQNQVNYYWNLNKVNFLLCHNEIDKKYFEGLLNNLILVYKMPSLMIEDSIKNIDIKQEDKTIIGGNFTDWYGGFPSYIVGTNFKNKIFAPQMGRMKKEELTIQNINHLSYMNWLEWMKTLSTFKYGVHLMRTYAAGTFALNCAYFGIPCIGYESLDTQRICHNSTTVKDGDIVLANQLAKKLKKDKEFYLHCSHRCKEEYKNNFSEKKFIQNMDNVFNDLLNK